MRQDSPILSFTATSSGISNILVTDVHVTKAFYPDKKEKPKGIVKLTALWDTGATNSAITQKVVDKCQLQPIGMTKVNTASGQDVCPTFLIGMGLPNKVIFNEVRVTLGVLSDVDVIIGMDIINRGDFAITNCSGKTIFSFRIPSIEVIDFVQQQNQIDTTKPKLGRNDPCHCGSGKKFKFCHGKKT